MFFLRHVNKNYLNFLIEQWPNPGLVLDLSVKPGLRIRIYYIYAVVQIFVFKTTFL